MILPKGVETKFHDFCERCPVCKIECKGTEFYANGMVFAEDRVVTCERYELCARLKQAGIIK